MDRINRSNLVWVCGVAAGLLATVVLVSSWAQTEEKPEAGAPKIKVAGKYTSEKLRDPFEPYVKKKEPMLTPQQLVKEDFTPPALKIQGISWGGRYPQAIVNDKVVKVGDLINGAQVVEIRHDGIVFSFKNRQFGMMSPALTPETQKTSDKRTKR